MAAGDLDPEIMARIEAYTDDLIARWPPLTDEQKDTIARILSGSGRGGRRAA